MGFAQGVICEPLNNFDSLKHSENFPSLQTLEHFKRVEHFESVRLSVELEGVEGLKIEFNALEWMGR